MRFFTYLLTSFSFTVATSIAIAETDLVEEQWTDSGQKVCVVNLHKNSREMNDQLMQMKCNKGDLLYLSEIQNLGMSKETVPMVSAQVCDMEKQLKYVALQYSISSVCTYSGELLPIGGSRKILRQGGLHKLKTLHTLIKD